MLVSVLIPSRKRVERLKKTIQSLRETASPRNYEVRVRIDNDDDESINAIPEFGVFENVHFLIGPRFNGYESNGLFFTELARRSKGDWLFIMNDDSMVIGEGWDRQLASLPKEGIVAYPEFYWLGQSRYNFSGSCGVAFPFVPNGCWQKFGWSEIEFPADQKLYDLLVVKHGWKVQLLKGVTLRHERDNDQTLRQHRL